MNTKRSKAVFTIAQDEPEYLPLWVNHHLQHFGPENTYVLNHDSQDKVAHQLRSKYGIQVIDLHYNESFSHEWLSVTVKKFQQFLLYTSYNKVLFAEVDELILVDPRKSELSLGQYIDQWQGGIGLVNGYQVLHDVRDENIPDVDWSKPLLEQDRKIIADFDYDKPLLATIPADWGYGFHYIKSDKDKVTRTDLVLLHLHYADFETALKRNTRRLERKWSQVDLTMGIGNQNRKVGFDLAMDFAEQLGKFAGHTKLEVPPEEWKTLVQPTSPLE